MRICPLTSKLGARENELEISLGEIVGTGMMDTLVGAPLCKLGILLGEFVGLSDGAVEGLPLGFCERVGTDVVGAIEGLSHKKQNGDGGVL